MSDQNKAEPPMRKVLQAFFQIPEVQAGIVRSLKVAALLLVLIGIVAIPPWPDEWKGIGIFIIVFPMMYVLYRCERLLTKTRKRKGFKGLFETFFGHTNKNDTNRN